MTQPALIPSPRQPELPWPAHTIYGARGAKWTAWTGTHHPCGICVIVIHERGVTNAPPPQPARMRRKGPGGGIVPADLYVCGAHGTEMKRRDAEQDEKAKSVAQLDKIRPRR